MFLLKFTKAKYTCSVTTATQAHISSHLGRGEQCIQALGDQTCHRRMEISNWKDRNGLEKDITQKGTMKRLEGGQGEV